MEFDEAPFLGTPPPATPDEGQKSLSVDTSKLCAEFHGPPSLKPRNSPTPALQLNGFHIVSSFDLANPPTPAQDHQKAKKDVPAIVSPPGIGAPRAISTRNLSTPHVQYKVLERIGKGYVSYSPQYLLSFSFLIRITRTVHQVQSTKQFTLRLGKQLP
jgi:hypothetical protein